MATKRARLVATPQSAALPSAAAPARNSGLVAIVAGLLLTAGLLALHFEHHRHAGGLWRDEVNSVNVVSRPTTAEVWSHIPYDSFPPVWISTLYAWRLAGLGGSDEGNRRLGLLIGLATLAVVWWTGRKLGVGAPLVTLLLFGMSPAVIVYGDMVRGYGIAALAIVWSVGALWSFVERPSRATYAIALLAFVMTAQTHWANSPLLLAIGIGAPLVAWRRHGASVALAALSTGAIAALLLIVVNFSNFLYISSTATQERGEWKSLLSLLDVFAESLATGSPALGYAWLLLPGSALLGCALVAARRSSGDVERALFAVAMSAVALIATLGIYELTRLPTQSWHYLSLVAVCALGCEIGIALLARSFAFGEWARIAAVAVIALVAAPSVAESVRMRMTSVDLAAQRITAEAKANDLVVVLPWFAGITFQRYYQGAAPWITLPEMPEHLFHLHLVILEKMKLGEAAVAPEIARVESTLRQGGRVWVVGPLVVPDAGLPALPQPLGSGSAGIYLDNWEQQLGALLEKHAGHGGKVEMASDVPINTWENLPLYAVDGWR